MEYNNENQKINDKQMVTKLDGLIRKANIENDEKRITYLSLLKKTLNTIIDGNDKSDEDKTEKNLILSHLKIHYKLSEIMNYLRRAFLDDEEMLFEDMSLS